MVIGYESFREAFSGYEDCYTIIGGTACDILMEEAGQGFRATKDIDMILLIENRFNEFAEAFWNYIKKGGYRCGWKSSEQLHFYRFTEPQLSNYPIMIELFSKAPNNRVYDDNIVLIPLHITDEISSLSAILLDEDYYSFMLQGRRIVDGIGVLGAEYLIPFKMRAWNDLKARKQNGEHVNSDDLKKHKNDVFRLYRIIDPEFVIVTNEAIKKDISEFIDRIIYENINMKQLEIDQPIESVLDSLRKIYQIGD